MPYKIRYIHIESSKEDKKCNHFSDFFFLADFFTSLQRAEQVQMQQHRSRYLGDVQVLNVRQH